MECIYGLLVLTIVFCVLIAQRYLKYCKNVESLRRLPGFRPRFLVGNLYDFGFLKPRNRKKFISDIFYFRLGLSTMYHEEGLVVAWLGPHPVLLITRARTAEIILSSQTLTEKSRIYHTLSDSLGTGLLISNKDKWRKDRKLITPAFHNQILDEFLEVMNDHSTILVQTLKEKSEGRDWLDPQEALNRCVLDILLDTSMDWNVRSEALSEEFLCVIERLINAINKRMYTPWYYSNFYYLFPEGHKFWRLTQYAHCLVDQKIDEKISKNKEDENRGTGVKRKVFLDILLEQQMTRKELRDQTNTFIVAGHHTVGNSLFWVLYLLGIHKDIQSKLYDELRSVFPGGNVEKVTKEHLKALKYMDCVLKETQRLYTTVPDVGRLISEDTVIGGYHIPAGTDCLISIASIHRDPDIYPDPERFDPDRFTPENSVGRSQYAFIPFSAGPRNCLGQRYALMKIKVVLCHIISKLTLHSMDPVDKIILVPEILSKPLDPLRIVFTPRCTSV